MLVDKELHNEDDESTAVHPIDLDDLLVNEIGQFGWFQLKNVIFLVLPIMVSAIFSDFIFVAAAVPYRCRIPECEKTSNTSFITDWVSYAISKPIEGVSTCQRFAYTGISNSSEVCSRDMFNRSNILTCSEVVYDSDTSLVRDFNLGCRDWMRVMSGSLLSLGGLFCLPVAGHISDRFGRRIVLLVSLFNMALIGVLRAFSINYYMFLALQFLWGFLANGTYSSAYIFATELVGPKHRVVVSSVCASAYALGHVVLSGVAWLVQPWRYLIVVLCTPSFLLISYYWLLSESVRWLLSKQKFEEARAVLIKAAAVNGNEISERSIRALMMSETSTSLDVSKNDSSLIQTIFKSPILLRRILTTPIWWVVTTFVDYSLSVNSTSLSGSKYLNFVLVNLVEIGGSFSSIFLLDRIGRRTTLFCGYTLSTICNFGFAVISPNLQTVRLFCYLAGKLGISVVFTSIYLYTAELYPTRHRHTLLALSSTVGTLGYITAPLTPLLMTYWESLPSILFGGMSLLAAVLVMTQPETLHTKLPDTLAEAEAIGQSESTRGSAKPSKM